MRFPAGRYLSGTLRLRSNITLQLDNGAILLASPDEADFAPYEKLPFESVSDRETTYFHYGLVTAENVENIAISGPGVIDGNRTRRGGPKTIAIKLCRQVSIRGVTVRNSPNYSISFWGAERVEIDGVTILNGYSDGIDPDSSRFVRIANTYIDCYDDAICPKASPSLGMDKTRPTEHLTVTNCTLRTNCSNFKFGTESSGDLRDVTLSNLTMLPRATGRRPISGISLESVDGAHIDGVVAGNITMDGVGAPIFLRLGNRGRGMATPVAGSLENVIIRGVVARRAFTTSSITAIPGYFIRNVLLESIRIQAEGGLDAAPPRDVPEHIAKYPEATMFGVLPAWALYARHVVGLHVANWHVSTDKPDVRPAFLYDDVRETVPR